MLFTVQHLYGPSLLPAAIFSLPSVPALNFPTSSFQGQLAALLPRAAAAAARAFSNTRGRSDPARNDSSFIIQLDQVS